jgi:flavin-dependent dehydrogenase
VTESVLIVGAGMTGLGAALALSGSGRKVILLERDPPPPDTSPDDAFEIWQRKGVGHLRHSHAFLAVLYRLIHKRYPELLRQLVEAGCRELKFADGLSDLVRKTYTPEPDDEILTILTSRRTTLEYVIRRYVAALDDVEIKSDTTVRDLLVAHQPDNPLSGQPIDVTGVLIERNGVTSEQTADLVVDAGGRNSQLVPWLIAKGASVEESCAPSEILYYTRHYRLLPGFKEPEPGGSPGAGDLGYIKFGIFPADNGCFSVTFALSELEMEMRKAIVNPKTFDALCLNIPGLARWTDSNRAEPKGKVLSMGNIDATWREFIPGNIPVASNFFAMGDAAIRTNPLYGRGCSFGFIQAHIFADVLLETTDPIERSRLFHTRVKEAVGPYFKDMVKQDKGSTKRAKEILDPNFTPSVRARLTKSFIEDGVLVLMRSNASMLREAMKAFHMVEKPGVWIRQPKTVFLILKTWARGKKRNAAYQAPKLGPERQQMFEALNVSWQADLRSSVSDAV